MVVISFAVAEPIAGAVKGQPGNKAERVCIGFAGLCLGTRFIDAESARKEFFPRSKLKERDCFAPYVTAREGDNLALLPGQLDEREQVDLFLFGRKEKELLCPAEAIGRDDPPQERGVPFLFAVLAEPEPFLFIMGA